MNNLGERRRNFTDPSGNCSDGSVSCLPSHVRSSRELKIQSKESIEALRLRNLFTIPHNSRTESTINNESFAPVAVGIVHPT